MSTPEGQDQRSVAQDETQPKPRKQGWFSLVDWLIIAMMAALGIAIKVIVVPLAHMITGPLLIPGGAVAGGFYMLFLVLGAVIIRKPGTATLIALIQAVVVFIAPVPGSHGAASLLTYTLPGVGIDLLFLLLGKLKYTPLGCVLAGLVANIIGTYAVNLALFDLPLIPMLLSLFSAALSGSIGGLIAYVVMKRLQKTGIVETEEQGQTSQ